MRASQINNQILAGGETRTTNALCTSDLMTRILTMLRYMNQRYFVIGEQRAIANAFWYRLPREQRRQSMLLAIDLVHNQIKYDGRDYEKRGSGFLGFPKMQENVNLIIPFTVHHPLLRPALVTLYTAIAAEIEGTAENRVQERLIQEEYQKSLGFIP